MKKNRNNFNSSVKLEKENVFNYPIEFKEFVLPNKLHCFLCKDSRIPNVFLTLGYKVGSKDELPGKKGIAHLFEHLMFQGSLNVKKNEHFGFLMKSGGVCNAFTMQDGTVYFDIVPSNNLEIALWLESDRMNTLNLTNENLENQKKVVIEEKKQRVDNMPYGSMMLNTYKYLFKDSAYESSVIGLENDINSFTVKEAVAFHKKYYSPENCVLIVYGDIEYDRSEELIHKYFSEINKKSEIKRQPNKIKKLRRNTKKIYYDNIQLPALNVCYQIPGIGSKEEYVFEYIAEILANNESSRLYKDLVYKKKMLQSANAIKDMLEDTGAFILNAFINPGVRVNDVKEIFLTALNDFAAKGCTDEEYERIKNKLEAKYTGRYLKMRNISVDAALNYLYFKNVGRINDEIKRYVSVSKHDIIDSVNKYLISQNNLTITYLPRNYKT